jgi:hypothetical protein
MKPVGAGLPAKAVSQAILMLDVTASSLASQLLQEHFNNKYSLTI